MVVVSLRALPAAHLESKAWVRSLTLRESGRHVGKQVTSKGWQLDQGQNFLITYFIYLIKLFVLVKNLQNKHNQNKNPGHKISLCGGMILMFFLTREGK